jgi:hypothetical protein
LLNLLNCHPKNVIALISKIPKGNPTPNPIARDLSDVVPCVGGGVKVVEVVGDSVRVVEVVGEVVCVVDRGVVN